MSRVPGVGEVQAFGSQYAMRIWLDPDKLVSYQLTSLDVSAAIQAQNAQVSAGQFGGNPAVPGQQPEHDDGEHGHGDHHLQQRQAAPGLRTRPSGKTPTRRTAD